MQATVEKTIAFVDKYLGDQADRRSDVIAECRRRMPVMHEKTGAILEQ